MDSSHSLWFYIPMAIIIASAMGASAYLERRRLLKLQTREAKRYAEEAYSWRNNVFVFVWFFVWMVVFLSKETFSIKRLILAWLYVTYLFCIPFHIRRIFVYNKMYAGFSFFIVFVNIGIGTWLLGYESAINFVMILCLIPIMITAAYMPSSVDFFNNIVLRTSDKVSTLMDAYAQSIFTYHFEIDKNVLKKPFGETLLDYAKLLGKNFIIADWEIFQNRGVYRIETQFRSFFSFRRKPVSYFEIHEDGKILVFVSPDDYRKIREPVTFEELCMKLTEAIEHSFRAFLDGNEGDAVSKFIGTPRYVPAYASWGKEISVTFVKGLGIFLALFALFIVYVALRDMSVRNFHIIFPVMPVELFVIVFVPIFVVGVSYFTTKKRLFTIKEG